MKARVTKTFCFEMAHALQGHDGPCKNIHGHSYQLSVTIIGNTNLKAGDSKSGMVMDFTDLKSIVEKSIIRKFDHSLVLNEQHAAELFPDVGSTVENVIKVNYQPTCENLAAAFAGVIQQNLPSSTTLHHIKLRETPTSYAEWYSEDNL